MNKYKPTTSKRWLTYFRVTTWTVALSLSLTACADKVPDYLGAPIGGYNHTSAAINRFSVNRGGGSNFGPYGGGNSQTCCVTMPVKWRPGLKVKVKWEKDPDPFAYADWPEKRFSKEWTKRMKESRSEYSRHEAVIEVAPYEKLGIVNVHFLPCDQVKVSAGATYLGRPDHPYNYPIHMEEPKTCPTL